jgi:hypothetical protein
MPTEVTYEFVEQKEPGCDLVVRAHVLCLEHRQEWTEDVAVIHDQLAANPLIEVGRAGRPFGICGLYRFLDQFRAWRASRGVSNKTLDDSRRW